MPRINYFIARFRDLPLHIALKKTAIKCFGDAAVNVEKLAAKLSPYKISDQELFESLEGFERLDEALQAFRAERPYFLIQPPDREGFAARARERLPDHVQEVIEKAGGVCRHTTDLLGSGPVELDDLSQLYGGREACGYLPWHFDFKTGYRWNPKKYYKEIRIPYGKADIKVPWELSRFQHAAVLGQAYWITGDEEYAREFVRQVEDWIDRNPVRFGVNWSCTMDVAIRVANWIMGYYFFKDSGVFSDDFLVKFLKGLLAHGRHIHANLENKGIANNHYLADIVGLIFLGVCFPELKEASGWREFGVRELLKEMERQVYEDGMDFEASTCYHRLALELFFYPALLCRRNGMELPQPFLDRLKRMFDFVLYALKPSGKMPQVGDSDNGRLFILGKRDVLDMTYLLTLAALFFDDGSYKIDEFGFAPEAFWLFGVEAYDRWENLPGRSLESLESRSFPNGGIYVMRHGPELYLLISCGPNGQGGIGGHGHNDKLSFELNAYGRDFIIDPGTFLYTSSPEWRNRFRSTSYHNTVVVDKEEQNPITKGAVFYLKDITRARCIEWKPGKDIDVFVGAHSGYTRFTDPVIHTRKLTLHKKKRVLEIVDLFSGKGEHFFEWNFIISPEYKDGLRIKSDKLNFKREPASYSQGYGESISTLKLTASTRAKLPADFKIDIYLP